ncbi:related to integral membrane protein [Fusarium proliferatum]|nr:related to integral membrane protein [Fusarium proliferatum]
MISEDIPSESNAVLIYAPSVAFFVVTPIFILFRFWSRVARRSSLGWDDTTIIISFFSALTVQTVMVVSWSYGFGRHIETLTTDDKLMALKLFYVAQIFYKLTANLAKISILLLYLRIFIQKWFRRCCNTLIGTIACHMSIASALSIWQCQPLRGAWDKSIQSTCISLNKNWHANAGFSIGTDTLILMLPMQPIWISQLPVAHKRALMIVLTMGGGVVIVTSIVRMATLDLATKTLDTTFEISSTMWTIIEQNLAIICTCLPMCRIPIAIILPSCFPNSNSNKSSHSVSQRIDGTRVQTGAWNPYVGPRSAQGLTRSVVLPNDEASEAVILGSLERTDTPSTLASAAGVIRKTVEYGVTYEVNPEANP